ncbi:2-oxoglutarate dehydrogenase E2 component [Propionibacteriaceae bacterium ES.041]|uniref:2-oxoglutarate dehydrogenase, E2 component, dihydrolipoamide succinyltransferase n=1 Tax=Enemella evansiae TaxID=2016499 RepID=UPI000B9703D3|nr:2-oxoglutarate dehydrogenase, E2 component, dihydrolipoamide succinyltransferase [Enemella evansiae]OYN95768.1 2-oxoglutarate dehydrogenase, E2 component, dihydrolipoamide succinyltransferase [Enemella evansiae]PFG68036.1 2-oxoglutarate dehydrogenase E2 component [Propionibacteriaceae bacterium ES.041]
MSTDVTLPALGESVTEGTVSRWLKQVGDQVETDEALLEISTDKVDTEIPSPTSGVLLEIKVDEDETVEVGAVLAVIGEEGESAGSDSGSDDQSADDDSADEEPESEPQRAADEDNDPTADEAAETGEQARKEAESDDQATAAEQPKPTGGTNKSDSGTEVTLPALGESVTEGTISRWLKQEGDQVEVDEALVEISTDKVDTEIPSPVAGTLLSIKAGEDETVEVGAVLAIIGDEGADGGSDAGESDAGESDAGKPASSASAPAGEGAAEDATDTQADDHDAQSVSGIEDQTEAGDEGGQEPIPAPETDDEPKQESKPEPKQEQKPEPKQESKPEPKQESKPEPKQQETAAPKAAPRSQGDDSAYVTPLVRKLAAEHDVDLSSLKGTGVGGRIRKQDVLAAAEEAKKAAAAPAEAEAPAAAAAPSGQTSAEADAKRGTTEKLSRMRQTIAKRMVESLQVSAQLTATVEVDLTLISRIRAQVKDDFKKRNGASLSYLPFITKAAVEALRQHPKVNATIDTEAGTVTYSDVENIGIAVDTERGLMVPVIADAGDLNIGGLAKKIADLANRTRTGKVTPDDLTGGTFTITNYGSAGTLFDTPIINQPQVAILGTGALVKRPMVMTDKNLGETIAVRDMMYLSLTYDHRLVDGADAARYLSTVKERLEEGDFGAEFGL